jgi:hypothetical protein
MLVIRSKVKHQITSPIFSEGAKNKAGSTTPAFYIKAISKPARLSLPSFARGSRRM